MTLLDRTKAPSQRPISAIKFIEPKLAQLSNGVAIYHLSEGVQEVVQLEYYFPGGQSLEHKKGLSYLLSKVMLDGTSTSPSSLWMDKVAGLGAFAECDSSPHFLKLSISIQTKNFERLLPLIEELFQGLDWNEAQFQLHKDRYIQQRLIQLKKTGFVATEEFRKALFPEHFYAAILTTEAMEALSFEDLKVFYEKQIKEVQPTLFLVGKFDEELLRNLSNSAKVHNAVGKPVVASHSFPAFERKQVLRPMESQQASIRIGRRMMAKDHQDVPNFQVLNALVGGFFGSRLMKNLREEKGYTYGVFSQLSNNQEGSFWVIGTDVLKESYQDAVSEIYKELDKLCEVKVDEEELKIVKNYMLGALLNSINSPFAHMERFKAVFFHQLDYSYYENLIHSIKSVTGEELLHTAKSYINPDNLMEIVAGTN